MASTWGSGLEIEFFALDLAGIDVESRKDENTMKPLDFGSTCTRLQSNFRGTLLIRTCFARFSDAPQMLAGSIGDERLQLIAVIFWVF